MRSQARRHVYRIDAIWLTLALMVLSAAVVAAAGWFVLQALLGTAEYIRGVL